MDLETFSFNSYIYYLTRAFNLLTRAFNLLTRAFSLPTGGFELVTRGLCSTCHKPKWNKSITKIIIITCGFELVTLISELLTRVLLFHHCVLETFQNILQLVTWKTGLIGFILLIMILMILVILSVFTNV